MIRPSRQSQSGVVLIIGLMILLVMTIVSFTAIQSSTMQEKMASNASGRNQAFQAAETALKEGEETLMALSCTALKARLADLPDPDNWNNAGTSVSGGSCDLYGCFYVLSEMPINQVTSSNRDDESKTSSVENLDTTPQCIKFFVVTAKAETGKGMYIVLQSTVFRKNNG